MPTFKGVMYAEAREQLRSFNSLNVLILGGATADLRDFLEKVSILHAYVGQTLGLDVSIKLHATNAFDTQVGVNFDITLHDGEISEDTIKELVQSADIDVVFDQLDVLSKRYAQDNFYSFQAVKSLKELVASCEDFLIGNDIPWLFSNITWNLPLYMRYFDRQGLCRDYFMFMGECRDSKGYTSEQQERLRYITNRLSQVEYSKDIIQSYLKRMRKAERNGYSEQDYNLELNYHVGNYYFLIAGILDSMARLINDVYRLRLTRHSLALEKDNFIEANKRKRTGYVRILKKKDFADWADFLKERRNFIAHDGDMRQSSLVEENEIPLSDEEVERLIDSQSDWSFVATILTPAQIRALRTQAAQIIRIQHDYRVIAKNAMFVPSDSGPKIYQPLPSIDYDYEKLADVLSKFLVRLKG